MKEEYKMTKWKIYFLSLCCAENYDNLGNLHRRFAIFLLLKTPTLQGRGRGRVAVAVGPHQESE